MKCIKCGNEIEDGSLFCTVCGAKQKVKETTNEVPVTNNVNYVGNQAPKSNRGLLIIIVVLLLIAIGIGVYFIIRSLDSNSSGSDPTPTPIVTPEPTPTPIRNVVCTGVFEEDGITMNAEVTGELDNYNKIKSVTVVYEVSDSSLSKTYCSLFKMAEDPVNDVTVTCTGNKIKITNYDKVDSDEDDEDAITGMSKKDFIELMEDEDYTCR